MATKTTCAYCGVGCGVEASFDNKALIIQGDKEHPANYGKLCVKGSNLHQTVGSENRLLKPRIGKEEVEWNEALDVIAAKIKQVVETSGPDSIAMYLSGQILTEDYYVANKLLKGFIGTANVDTNSRLCMASTVVGHKRAFGEDVVPGCYEDLNLADLILFVGSNAAWNHPIIYQRISEAKENNPKLKVVLIDPRRTATADIADLHLALKPGTDALLFNALLSRIKSAGALNTDYIVLHTQGFDTCIESAESDLAEQNIADELGVNSDQLEQFFEWFIDTDKVVSLFSQGINQSSSGTDKVNSIINCHLATGRIGKPGMGPFSLTGQPNAMGGREVGGLANQLAAHEDFSDPVGLERVREFWRAANLAISEGKKAVDMFDAIENGDIKVVWIMATNPVVSMPNANKIKRALEKAELVIVSESMSETDTLTFADVALPATTWSEKQGTVTNSDRLISRQRGFLPAPGKAKHDWWAICEVAKRLGFEQSFDFESPADIFREHAALSGFKNGGRRLFDISYWADITDEEYEALIPTQWPVTSQTPKGTQRLFGDGAFTTPSKRANFIPITHRAPVQQPTLSHPFTLNTGRIRDQWHTMTRSGRSATLFQHLSEPFVSISPVDADKLGIEGGDLVRIQHQSNGEVVCKATFDEGLRQGELFIPMHWTEQFSSDARVNQLIEEVVDPFSGQPESKQGSVAIRKLNPVCYAAFATVKELKPADLQGFTYWSIALVENGFLYTLASSEENFDWNSWYTSIAGRASIKANGLHLNDLRLATVIDGYLESVLAVSVEHSELGVSWIKQNISQLLTNQERAAILSLNAPLGVKSGNVVCSCFKVTDEEIQTAVEEGVVELRDLQKSLKCGSNCGSCIPEIRQVINYTLSVELS